MSLDDIFNFGRRPRTRTEMLQAQIDGMSRDIRRISHSLSQHAGEQSGNIAHTAAELGRTAMHEASALADEFGHHAIRGARAVKRDPLPVIAVLGTTVLLASLFARRR